MIAPALWALARGAALADTQHFGNLPVRGSAYGISCSGLLVLSGRVMAQPTTLVTRSRLFGSSSLRSIFRSIGVLQPADIVSIKRTTRGRANKNYVLRFRDKSAAILRIYANDFVPTRSAASIEYEHVILRRLSDMGFPVPCPLSGDSRARNKVSLARIDGSYVSLFPLLPGDHPSLGSAELRHHAAVTLASLHTTSERVRDLGQRPTFARHTSLDWAAPEKSATDWFQFVAGFSYAREQLPGDQLAESLTKTLDSLRRAGFDQHPVGLIHGDLNAENLLATNQGITGILDFDHCQLESPIVDLAFTTWQICREPPDFLAFDTAAIEELLHIYLSHNKLEAGLFDAFVPCMTLWLLRYMIWTARQLSLDPKRPNLRRRVAASVGPTRLGLLDRSATEIELALIRATAGFSTAQAPASRG